MKIFTRKSNAKRAIEKIMPGLFDRAIAAGLVTAPPEGITCDMVAIEALAINGIDNHVPDKGELVSRGTPVVDADGNPVTATPPPANARTTYVKANIGI